MIFMSGALRAQIELVPFDALVTHETETLRNPWAGGFNAPQFSQIDLNTDGKKDLVVFERDFYGSVKTFINTGTNGEAIYDHVPKWQSAFPPMRNWMLLRDYNCDGLEDIFTSVPGGIKVYRNEGTSGGISGFSLESSLLLTNGPDGAEPLYVAITDVPAITDGDGDGDLDVLSFNIIGSTLQFHKNLSMENYGNCKALEFELANPCWGYFSEDGNNNTVGLFDTCDVDKPEKKAGILGHRR